MIVADLLNMLRRRGLTVAADGDALLVRPGELLTDELRAAIRANKPAILAKLAADDACLDPRADAGIERRRGRALKVLAENPNIRRAVICEAGDPAIIGIALRTLGYCELEVPAEKYDPVALVALLDQYADTTQ